jgi:hypothetical protein
MAAKKLNANVAVDGTWYGPDYPDAKVSADVAKRIENPNVWESAEDGGDGRALLEGQESPDSYVGVKASVLKAEIKRRNADRDDADKIQASGSEADLAAALLADDEPHTA